MVLTREEVKNGLQQDYSTIVEIGAFVFETVRHPNGTYTSRAIGPSKEAKESATREIKKPAPADNTLLAVFPSGSGGDPHVLRWSSGLGVCCTCLGYGYRKYCRYTRFLEDLIKSGETTLESLAERPIKLVQSEGASK